MCTLNIFVLALSEPRGSEAWARIARLLWTFSVTVMPAPESVVLETSLGNIQLELYWNHAPRVRLPCFSPEHEHNR